MTEWWRAPPLCPLSNTHTLTTRLFWVHIWNNLKFLTDQISTHISPNLLPPYLQYLLFLLSTITVHWGWICLWLFLKGLSKLESHYSCVSKPLLSVPPRISLCKKGRKRMPEASSAKKKTKRPKKQTNPVSMTMLCQALSRPRHGLPRPRGI